MGEDLERIFDALGHRVRRKIVEELGKRGSATYSELMKASGVEDSGTFAFHLKKLLDLGIVRKNERGEYELTDLGKRAFSILKMLSSEVEVFRPGVERLVTVSDTTRYVLTREVAEKLRAEGRKLRIERVAKVVIESMPRELLESVLESIEDCSIVEAPSELMDIAMARSRGVTIFKDVSKSRRLYTPSKSWEREVSETLSKVMTQIASLGPRIASIVITSVTSSIPRIIEYVTKVFEEREAVERIEIPSDIKKISINANSSLIVVKRSDRAELVVKKRRGDVRIDIQNSTLELGAEAARVMISIPRSVDELRAVCNSSSLRIEGLELGSAVLEGDTSSLNIDRVRIGRKLVVWLNTSLFVANTIIDPANRGVVDVSSSISSVNLDISIPRSVRVSIHGISRSPSAIDIEVDGSRVGLDYREPGYEEATKKLDLRLDVDSTAMKARVTHRETV